MLIAEQMTPAAIELARLLSYFADIDGSEDMKRRDRTMRLPPSSAPSQGCSVTRVCCRGTEGVQYELTL
ncbi:hypothetical protein, partial [Sinorhizobium meliloti]|uniref:hypothetical protein n=1 Tax=Rhizobium meliloti TaxID=382 RepID=UPI001F2068D9